MLYACSPLIYCLYSYVFNSIYWCGQDFRLMLSGLAISVGSLVPGLCRGKVSYARTLIYLLRIS